MSKKNLTKADKKFLRSFLKKAKVAKKQLRKPAKKTKTAKRSKRRDPALYRSPLLRKKRGTNRTSAVHPWYVMRDPSWYGHEAGHKKAAKKGHAKFKRAHGRGYPTKAQARKAGKKAHRHPR